jgi:enoyl-CoA hydratase/carnithine racemase
LRGRRLVNRVIPFDAFEAEVTAYARMLADEVSPLSLRAIKRELWNAQFQTLGEATESANTDMRASFTSEDFKEGVAHYLEKRPPAFIGR